jgi:serine protease Do
MGGDAHGVFVEDIEQGSSAERAGVQVGDVILSINDKRVVTMDDITQATSKAAHGTKVTLKVYRNNGITTVLATL